MVVSTLAARYIAERFARGELARSSATNYRIALRVFAKRIGDPVVQRVNPRVVERWFEALDVEASTKAAYLATVRGFCRWLVANGWLRSDPTAGLEPPRRPRRVPRRLDEHEVTAVFEALPDRRAVLIVSLEVQEGLRVSEVVGLELGDIDADRRMRVHGKGSRDRIIPITSETWQVLLWYLDEHPAASGPLIRSKRDPRRGISPAHGSRIVSEWMLAAGVKRRPRDGKSGHAFRHTAATDMLAKGAKLRNVQRLLGHASLSTTEGYLAWEIGDLRDDMEGRHYRHPPLQVEGDDADTGADRRRGAVPAGNLEAHSGSGGDRTGA